LDANYKSAGSLSSYLLTGERASRLVELSVSKSLLVKLGAGVTRLEMAPSERDGKALAFSLGLPIEEDGSFDCDGDVMLEAINEVVSKNVDAYAIFGSGDENEPLGLSTLAGVKKLRYDELNKDTIDLVKRQFLEANPNAAKPGWIICPEAWNKLYSAKALLGKGKYRGDMDKGMLEGFPCFQLKLSETWKKGSELYLGDWASFNVRCFSSFRLVFSKKTLSGGRLAFVITGSLAMDFLRDPKRFVGARPKRLEQN
jgi:hypothetical protein